MAWTPKSLRGLEPYLRRYRGPLLGGIACAVGTDLLALWPPWLAGRGVDAVREGAAPGALLGIAAVLLAAVAVSGCFAWAMRRLMTGTSRHVEYDLQHDLYVHLLRLPPSTHDRLRGGDLMSRLTNDLAAVRDVLGPGLMWAVQMCTQTLLVAGLMVWVSPWLSVYALAPLPVLWLVTVWASRGTHDTSLAAQAALASLSHRATVAFGGIRVVQAFRREDAERAAFGGLDRAYVDANLAQARVRALFMPALVALPGLSVGALLWAGATELWAGRVSLGDLLAFLLYVRMLVRPMLYLGWTVTIHQRGAASLERVREVLGERPEDPGGAVVPASVAGRLQWRSAAVGYREGAPVLRDCTLAVAPGEFVAVVGPIGAGKSSLLQTLPRLLDPPPGQVFVDGVDVRAWPVERLRAAIGYVADTEE